jgi:hypothetical protein
MFKPLPLPKPLPFYGFSGLNDPAQLMAVLNHTLDKSNRRLMFRANMNSASLRKFHVEDYKNVIDADVLRGLFCSVPEELFDEPNYFPVINFTSDGPNTIDSELLHVDRLVHMPEDKEVAVLSRLIKGFQITEALPDPKNLKWFQERHLWPKPFEMILQLGKLAMKQSDNDPEKLAKLVESYKGVINYVILDTASCKINEFCAKWAKPYIKALTETCPDIGVCVAGRLGPKSMKLVQPLLEEFPDLSVLAETELKDKYVNFTTDKAILYFNQAVKVIEGRKI